MRFDKFRNKFFICIFLLFIFSVCIYLGVSPDHKKSFIENRTLAQKPDLTLSSLASGEYVRQYEEYVADQFPGRNIWLKLKLKFQQMSGKTYIYDYYVTDDNWIMPKPKRSFSKEKMTAIANKVNDFAERVNIDVYYFSLPHKVNTVKLEKPAHIPDGIFDERRDYFLSKLSDDNMKIIDVGKLLKEAYTQSQLNQMYFKTDHHWNIFGAFNAYEEIRKVLDRNSKYFAKSSVKFNTTCYDNKEFEGSYNRQIYMIVDSSEERVCHILPENNFKQFTVYNNGKKVAFDDVYGSGIRSHKPNYADVYTDDLRELKIVNPNHKKGEILIIKDSYANPIAFHVSQHFHQTTVYDVRHNRGRSLYDYIKKNPFDIIIFLYNDANINSNMFEFN